MLLLMATLCANSQVPSLALCEVSCHWEQSLSLGPKFFHPSHPAFLQSLFYLNDLPDGECLLRIGL